MNKKLNIGDVVFLKSHGCRATVNGFPDEESVECIWFDKENHFHAEKIKIVVLDY